ncbi:alpha/beta hydrolase [Algoriphagus sp. D3-2-R+10]|uniref:alpha/beta fold hydrolase n=1 Tax=Algoriphagus aurantiacus TaxID=3103948 RepID=UPI002B3EBC82|nr:alpha/beta hydrolase [Algoriphagus sp. D3-2-R+10]MEB2777567.1 alpha/beta hydrolase [Algoriphagus sp. D3-2-R+10]
MKINDYVFELIEKGKGETVVFVHGSVSDYRTWQKQQEEFSKRHHTISYSRRFHWPNEQISEHEDYSINQHMEDLEALIKKLNVPVHLIGHSYGAFICLLLAMKSPHVINSLVLSEPPIITLYVSNSPKPLEILKLLFSRPRTAIALIKLGVKGIEPATKEVKSGNMKKAIEIFGKATLGSDTYKNLSDLRMEQVYSNAIKAEFVGSGFPHLDINKIREIKIPTLLVSGRNTPKIFHFLLGRLMELLPKVERKIIEGASHISHEDNALDYNKTVLSFIEKHSP